MILSIILAIAAAVLLYLLIREILLHAKTEEQLKKIEDYCNDKAFISEREKKRIAFCDEIDRHDALRAQWEKDDAARKISFEKELAALNESTLRDISILGEKARKELAEAGQELQRLHHQIDTLSANRAPGDAALIPMEFSFDDLKSYQDAIRGLEADMESMIKAGHAASWNGGVSIVGVTDRAETQMMNNLTRLALRAFNGECDAAIAKANHKNLVTMEDRIKKSEAAIERLLEKWGITISDKYRNLRIKELRLTYEQAVIEQRHREKQREEAQRMREEARLRVEAEQAQQDAELEERRIVESLAKARAELELSHASDLAIHAERVKELESRLAEAEAKTQRAMSMAQQTKAGHVYIISNIGSFGDGVFKIGMTRRLDPMDRIWELSCASVPFDFDVHGMIYSDDAPALEAEMHRIFDKNRVNMVNDRREFFHVSIADIQMACERKGLDIKLVMDAEAIEWRQSQSIRAKRTSGDDHDGISGNKELVEV